MASLEATYVEQTEAQQEALAADKAIVKAKLGLAEKQARSNITAIIEQYADADNRPPYLDNPEMLTAADVLWINNMIKDLQGKGPQAFSATRQAKAV